MVQKMYCPRCGKDFKPNISYCRACGLALDGVSEIVTGAPPERERKKFGPNVNFMRAGVGLFILGLVIALGNAALRPLIGQHDGPQIIFLAFVALGLLCIGGAFVFPDKRYTRHKRRADQDADSEPDLMTSELDKALEGKPLESEIEFPKDGPEPVSVERPSVTEHTTRQLG